MVPAYDVVTDFNPFLHEVARITKERNLVLVPITIVIIIHFTRATLLESHLWKNG
jgi:hypothetical protein